MESGANAPQVLIDLGASILKLLGRPAIQQQLLLGLFAIVLAWGLAQWIITGMRRRDAVRMDALRQEILAETRARLAEIDGESGQTVRADSATAEDGAEELSPSEGRARLILLLQNEETLTEAAVQRRGPASRVRALLQQILFPLLAIGFLYVGYIYAVASGWYSGLIVDLIVLVLFYFIYRLIFGIAFALGNPDKIAYFQHRLFGPLIFVVVLLLILNIVGDLSALSSARVISLAEGWLTLGTIFVISFGFYLWIMGLSLVKELIQAFVGWRSNVNMGSLEAGLTLVQYCLVGVGLFGVLRLLQINTATIAAITGGLAIGVGLALQDVLKNFLGGIIILFEGSVRPGDWVEIAGTEGAIDKLSIRSTVVRTFDNVEYIVPNQDWLNSTVTTFTRSSRLVRTRVPIGVSYDADPHVVQQLLVEVASNHPQVLPKPAPVAPLVAFSDSSLDFVVLAWVEDAMMKGMVAGQLRLQIWDTLKENGIEMPYPQRDIHIRSATLPFAIGMQDRAIPTVDTDEKGTPETKRGDLQS